MTTDRTTETRTAEARAAHARGWALTPLNGKRPFVDGWQAAPMPSLEHVLRWAQKGNLGLRTGEVSGLLVIDIDEAKGGAWPFGDPPVTPTVVTGGGGRHLYFRLPTKDGVGIPIKNWVAVLAPHVDIRTTGAQVVYVGSVHPVTQQVYRWAPGLSPDEVDLAELPQAAIDLLPIRTPEEEQEQLERRQHPTVPLVGDPSGSRWADKALQLETDAVRTAPGGARNSTLNRAAFSLAQIVAGGGLDEGATRCALYASAEACGLVKEDGSTAVLKTIESGWSKGVQSPRQRPGGPWDTGWGLRAVGRAQTATAAAPELVHEPDAQPSPSPNGLPEVLTPGPHTDENGEYHEIGNDDFAAAVLRELPEGLLYRRADRVGEISGDPGQQQFVPCTQARMRLLVDQHIRLLRWVRKKNEEAVRVYVNCNNDHAVLLLDAALTHASVRELHSLTSYPVFLGDALELATPGWNEEHGVYYDEPPELAELPEEVKRLQGDLNRIHAVLDDLVVDFPFKNDASRHNFFGLLLTPLLRPAIEGNVPMHLIHSSLERTGKTKLAEEVLGGVILGRPQEAMQLAPREEEREKRILSNLRRGDTLLHLDNIRDFIDSPSLASLLTSTWFSGRVLGVSEIATVRNALTIVATGNNVRATGEIVKRTVPIHLQPATPNPEDRTDFKHPELRGYIAEHRMTVLASLIALVARWRDETRWLYPKPIGGYERWTALVGGILGKGGFASWIENYRTWVREADPQGADLRAFVNAWAERVLVGFKSTAAELAKLADDAGLFPQIFQGKNERGGATAFAMRVLRKNVDTPVERWVIRKTGDAATALYYLDEQQ